MIRNADAARIKTFAVGLPEKMKYGKDKEMETAIRKPLNDRLVKLTSS